MSLGTLLFRIVGGESKIDFIVGRGDEMPYRNTVLEGAEELQFRTILGCGNQFCLVTDHSVLAPIRGL